MTDPVAPTRFTLRSLPLPAKLVLTVFLVAVGLGYLSALVQMHLQHSSREGEALPTMDDVVAIFAGVKRADPNAPAERPVSKLEKLIMGKVQGEAWSGTGSMAPAFFHRDDGVYKALLKEDPEQKPKLDAERDGERKAVRAWITADPDARVAAYAADRFPLPAELTDQPITPDYRHEDDKKAVKVQSILNDRCVRCHSVEGPQGNYPLENYKQIDKYMRVKQVPQGWVPSGRQISEEKLTQSTHAHLLSFAMLFALTGLTFAFTGYPALIRAIVAPLVLVAEVADVSCWWLARLPESGPYFAMAIPFTGGLGGAFLMIQIVLSLLDLYGTRGKAVLVLLLAAAAAGLGVLTVMVIRPALEAERRSATEPKPEASQLERLIMGPVEGPGLKWDGGPQGSMAGAFFHKDGAGYRREVKERPKAEVDAERDGERKALQAWINADPAARKAAYEADLFALPSELAGKPITPDYGDGKAAKVKSILTDRCARCHGSGSEQEEHPLETYEQVLKYIEAKK